jgi:hypothetical protein
MEQIHLEMFLINAGKEFHSCGAAAELNDLGLNDF